MLKKFIFLIILFLTVVFVRAEEIGEMSVSVAPGGMLPMEQVATLIAQ